MIIYITTNLINGKKYIGKDKNNIPSYIGGGILLKEDIKKYGKNNFKKEILEYCFNVNDLKQKEIFWLEYFNAANNSDFYNLTNKSYGSVNGPTFTKKYIKRGKTISEAKKGKKYPNIGKALKGKKRPEISKALLGKKKSKEHCENLSKAKKGIPSSKKGKPDYKQRGKPKPGAGPKKGSKNPNAGRNTGVKIIDTETNIVYDFVKDVLKEFGFHKRKLYIILKENNGRFKYLETYK
jgi:group I intron endonuclease